MQSDRQKVVILGANGTMGAGAAEVFAAAGYQVTMLARSLDKAGEGLTTAQAAAKAEALAENITLGTYQRDLAKAISEAAIVYESLAEDLGLKRDFLARVDQHRKPDSIVATGSSGLSIAAMAKGRSDSFRKHFLGIHLFNPPHVIVGTEVIPHAETEPSVIATVTSFLSKRLGRKVIVTADLPAFVGNRVGFKVLNEVAQLAADHGVAFMDYLIGPQTGRAMAPLATIDLVGWDVHQAIVDNVFANCTADEARACFKLPDFMVSGIAAGQLGDKTPQKGGFYRRLDQKLEVLDPRTGGYRPLRALKKIGFVEQMKTLNRVGRYREAFAVLKTAEGPEADLCRRVVLGYISYGLNRAGEAARAAADVDTIMSYGFNWTPPCALADLISPRETLELIRRYGLKAPPVLEQAVAGAHRLYSGSLLECSRTLAG